MVPLCLLSVAYAQLLATSAQATLDDGEYNGHIQLHGSGTSNPSKYFWKTMDLFEERSKIPVKMTYRSVGSGTGQNEFVGDANSGFKPYNHFGSGDIPMGSDKFQTLTDNGRQMVHIPFSVGAIAVFHSVPGVTPDTPIDLDACTLAKVFSRQIKTWDDPAIKALNPNIDVPAGVGITVLHRLKSSSSTAGLANYLHKATRSTCPDAWPDAYGPCKVCPWEADTVTVEGSSNMAKSLGSTSYAIGYLDAGHGHAEGFAEIKLKNAAGKWLYSSEANIGAAGSQALMPTPSGLAPAGTTTDASADWSAVNLYDLDGDDTWPIVMFSYFYVAKDCSGMNKYTAGLLKAFIKYTLSAEGHKSLEEFRFTPPTQSVIDVNTRTIGDPDKGIASVIIWPTGMPEFILETKETMQAYVGAGYYVLSGKRETYADVTRKAMEKDISALQSKVNLLEERLNARAPIQLHGAGTTNPSKFFWKTMDLFEERAKVPLFMTYRAVGSSTGQAEFLGADNGNKPWNHFGSGDIPMKAANYQTLMDNGGNMVHIPFVMGAIAVFHSVPDTTASNPIHLDACTLAKVFSRQIKTWDHADIKAINAGVALPSAGIVVVHRKKGSSSTSGLTNYLKESCPEHWTLDAGSTITWPEDTVTAEGSGNMANTLATTQYAIGYLDAGHGHSEGFAEIALENFAKKYLTSDQAVIADAGTQALAGATSVIPADPSSDWSSVELYDLPGDDTWPITLFSYFYIEKDLSKMDPRTAGLLKAFIEYTLSEEGQASLEGFSFSGVPSQVLTYNAATLNMVTWPKDMVTFDFELGSTTRAEDGAKPYCLSGKRKTYADVARDSMQKDIAALQVAVVEANHAATIASLVERIEILEQRNLEDKLQAKKDRDALDMDVEAENSGAWSLLAGAALFLGVLQN
jgi:ABC-type phosphate transport system substrate-binding protein